jgi:hypothetical protein
MAHLDPYGYGPNTAAPTSEADIESVAETEREEEIDLARGIPESEQQPVSEDLSASGLDIALRLQDGIGTWLEGGDTTPEEVGHADDRDPSEPEPEPFVPLIDSGGQGI